MIGCFFSRRVSPLEIDWIGVVVVQIVITQIWMGMERSAWNLEIHSVPTYRVLGKS